MTTETRQPVLAKDVLFHSCKAERHGADLLSVLHSLQPATYVLSKGRLFERKKAGLLTPFNEHPTKMLLAYRTFNNLEL